MEAKAMAVFKWRCGLAGAVLVMLLGSLLPAQVESDAPPAAPAEPRRGAAQANGIEIAYEIHGPASGEPVLLIMGLGGQLTAWPQPLIQELVGRGFRVIIYDNRDVGLSTKLDDAGLPDLSNLFNARPLGTAAQVPYTLDDMALDAVALLDQLGVPAAHLVGVSMGGHIAHLIAADHPEHALSLTSIMSGTLNPSLPPPSGQVLQALNMPDRTGDLPGFQEDMVHFWKVVGSRKYPTDPEVIRARAKRDFERSYYPAGAARHFAAILAGPDQRPKLKTIQVPAVVVHGADDPLASVDAGKDTAANIPGAELRIIEGMGHDLPNQLIGVFADAITAATQRARQSRAESTSGQQP